MIAGRTRVRIVSLIALAAITEKQEGDKNKCGVGWSCFVTRILGWRGGGPLLGREKIDQNYYYFFLMFFAKKGVQG